MCRFIAYLGPPMRLDALVTRPANSLIHQSYDSQERAEPLNGDGFGVAWYMPSIQASPVVYRSITPAWNDRNLLALAPVTVSQCVFAHVRAASPGLGVTQTNCHPFQHGPYAFMHNGYIGDFASIRRRMLQSVSDTAYDLVEGTTDSETMFAVFADALGDRTGLEAMADAIMETVHCVTRLTAGAVSQLNLAVTDGYNAVFTRHCTANETEPNSLYVSTGREYICLGDECRMVSPAERGAAVVVSSEKLSDDPSWERVAASTMVLVSADGEVQYRPVEA